MEAATFKTGDVVDVLDLRDPRGESAVVRGAVILEVCPATPEEQGAGLRGDYASLDAGFRVSVRCLRAAKPESRL